MFSAIFKHKIPTLVNLNIGNSTAIIQDSNTEPPSAQKT